MKPPFDLTTPDEPITLEECRRQCSLVPDVDSDDNESHPDDALLLALLAAAREHCERWTGCLIARREVELSFDGFPARGEPLELGVYPVNALLEVVYTDATGSSSSSSSSDAAAVEFTLDDRALPAALHVTGGSWPATASTPNAVRVRVDAGWRQAAASSDDATPPLPAALRHAVLLILSHLYENREASAEKALTEIPLGVESFLRHHRFKLGMA